MHPTDAAIKAAYRDENVPLHVWAASVGIPMSTLNHRIAQLELSGRKQVHGGGMPRRFSDAELLAMRGDRTRTVAEIGAGLSPPMAQAELSKMFRRLGLGKRPAVRRPESLEGVGESARVADARKCAAGQVLETPARRLGLPAVTGETR